MRSFVDVILPLPLSGVFTYKVPADLQPLLQYGSRVVVPFGAKKYYTGIIVAIHGRMPRGFQVKEIITVLDTDPVVLPSQIDYWQWLASYYLCTIGDVYKAALPSGLRLESETLVSLNPDYEDEFVLTPEEELLFEFLNVEGEVKVSYIEKIYGKKQVLRQLRSLIDRGILILKEELSESYQSKTETYIALSSAYRVESELQTLFDELHRAPKQLELLMSYVQMSGWLNVVPDIKEVSRRELLEKTSVSPAILNALVKKKVFEVYKKEVSRLEDAVSLAVEKNDLNEHQQKALIEIREGFAEKDVVLLHGVTSSGKTEVYIHLIQDALERGKQVLYLLPEIALTTQITARLKKVFGHQLGVYHSKFSGNERIEIWNDLIKKQKYRIIIGVRSSIFLPFTDLGLIIVDEEHENSYKQYDPAPRYQARDAAIMLAHKQKAKVLLGSATPSLESYHNAGNGKYKLVELLQRYSEVALPHILCVDMKEQVRKKLAKGPFSDSLLTKMKEALAAGEQVILFQNRRGYAPFIECPSCAWVPKCDYCDVSLTYHKRSDHLACHYCGNIYPLPRKCPSCGNEHLIHRGFGTEKIEDELQAYLPEARTGRMDLDTTRSKNNYLKIISDFEQGKINVLIGTQMISKGLDFENVSLVGILNADSMLNYPDFRSFERAYQLMAQVAGRAGRRKNRGCVLLQTRQPENIIIRQVVENDYTGMYNTQLRDRTRFKYPPFYRLITLYLKHKDKKNLEEKAVIVASGLRELLGNRVLGPDEPVVGKVQTYHIQKIILKIEPKFPVNKLRKYLEDIVNAYKKDPEYRALQIYFDVDPM